MPQVKLLCKSSWTAEADTLGNVHCRAFRLFGKEIDFIVSPLVFANTERPESTTKEVATVCLLSHGQLGYNMVLLLSFANWDAHPRKLYLI